MIFPNLLKSLYTLENICVGPLAYPVYRLLYFVHTHTHHVFRTIAHTEPIVLESFEDAHYCVYACTSKTDAYNNNNNNVYIIVTAAV